MKNNKGVTLVSLVITILVLSLLMTVTVTSGLDTYNTVKVQNFISKMKVIQDKVDNLVQETEDITSLGLTKLVDIASTDPETYQLFSDMITNPTKYHIDTSNSWIESLDGEIENYYYVTGNDFDKIGLKNQDLTVIINFETRNIMDKNGVKQEDIKYYRQYDLDGGETLIEMKGGI